MQRSKTESLEQPGLFVSPKLKDSLIDLILYLNTFISDQKASDIDLKKELSIMLPSLIRQYKPTIDDHLFIIGFFVKNSATLKINDILVDEELFLIFFKKYISQLPYYIFNENESQDLDDYQTLLIDAIKASCHKEIFRVLISAFDKMLDGNLRRSIKNECKRYENRFKYSHILTTKESDPLSRHTKDLDSEELAALDRGLSRNIKDIHSLKNYRGRNILQIAIEKNFINTVQHLVDHYPTLINQQDDDGNTALHIALQMNVVSRWDSATAFLGSALEASFPSEESRAKIIRILMPNANKDIVNHVNKTPSQVYKGTSKTIKDLLEENSEDNKTLPKTIFFRSEELRNKSEPIDPLIFIKNVTDVIKQSYRDLKINKKSKSEFNIIYLQCIQWIIPLTHDDNEEKVKAAHNCLAYLVGLQKHVLFLTALLKQENIFDVLINQGSAEALRLVSQVYNMTEKARYHKKLKPVKLRQSIPEYSLKLKYLNYTELDLILHVYMPKEDSITKAISLRIQNALKVPTDINGNNALHTAVEFEKWEIIKLLLNFSYENNTKPELKYDINQKNNDGLTPLQLALMKEQYVGERFVAFLIEKGAQFYSICDYLHYVKKYKREIEASYFKSFIQPNCVRSLNKMDDPLKIAIEMDSLAAVTWILEKDIDISKPIAGYDNYLLFALDYYKKHASRNDGTNTIRQQIIEAFIDKDLRLLSRKNNEGIGVLTDSARPLMFSRKHYDLLEKFRSLSHYIDTCIKAHAKYKEAKEHFELNVVHFKAYFEQLNDSTQITADILYKIANMQWQKIFIYLINFKLNDTIIAELKWKLLQNSNLKEYLDLLPKHIEAKSHHKPLPPTCPRPNPLTVAPSAPPPEPSAPPEHLALPEPSAPPEHLTLPEPSAPPLEDITETKQQLILRIFAFKESLKDEKDLSDNAYINFELKRTLAAVSPDDLITLQQVDALLTAYEKHDIKDFSDHLEKNLTVVGSDASLIWEVAKLLMRKLNPEKNFLTYFYFGNCCLKITNTTSTLNLYIYQEALVNYEKAIANLTLFDNAESFFVALQHNNLFTLQDKKPISVSTPASLEGYRFIMTQLSSIKEKLSKIPDTTDDIKKVEALIKSYLTLDFSIRQAKRNPSKHLISTPRR